jgi:PST family polysaccharide transporter
VGIAMAAWRYGYWSLVGMQLATALAELVLTVWASGWRPGPPLRGSGTRPLLGFGASLTVADIFRRLAAGADTLLLGRFYGADAVGLYSRGALLLRPLVDMLVPLECLFAPALSRLQNEPERYRRVFLQAYNAMAMLTFPCAGLGLALSQPLVLALLGAKWERASPIFACFSLAGLFLLLYHGAMWVLDTQARGKDIMTTAFVLSLATVASVAAGLPFGPVGVALAFSCTGLLVRLPLVYYVVGRREPVSTGDLWRVFFRYLPNWAVVLAVTSLARDALFRSSPVVQLCLCVPLGFVAAAAVTSGVPAQRREALRLAATLSRALPKGGRVSKTATELGTLLSPLRRSLGHIVKRLLS